MVHKFRNKKYYEQLVNYSARAPKTFNFKIVLRRLTTFSWWDYGADQNIILCFIIQETRKFCKREKFYIEMGTEISAKWHRTPLSSTIVNYLVASSKWAHINQHPIAKSKSKLTPTSNEAMTSWPSWVHYCDAHTCHSCQVHSAFQQKLFACYH